MRIESIDQADAAPVIIGAIGEWWEWAHYQVRMDPERVEAFELRLPDVRQGESESGFFLSRLTACNRTALDRKGGLYPLYRRLSVRGTCPGSIGKDAYALQPRDDA